MLVTSLEHQLNTTFLKHSNPRCIWLRVANYNDDTPSTRVMVLTITFSGKFSILIMGTSVIDFCDPCKEYVFT